MRSQPVAIGARGCKPTSPHCRATSTSYLAETIRMACGCCACAHEPVGRQEACTIHECELMQDASVRGSPPAFACLDPCGACAACDGSPPQGNYWQGGACKPAARTNHRQKPAGDQTPPRAYVHALPHARARASGRVHVVGAGAGPRACTLASAGTGCQEQPATPPPFPLLPCSLPHRTHMPHPSVKQQQQQQQQQQQRARSRTSGMRERSRCTAPAPPVAEGEQAESEPELPSPPLPPQSTGCTRRMRCPFRALPSSSAAAAAAAAAALPPGGGGAPMPGTAARPPGGLPEGRQESGGGPGGRSVSPAAPPPLLHPCTGQRSSRGSSLRE